MNKLLLAVAFWVGMLGAGWARTVEQQLLASLQAQGYVILEQGYTILGRLRIVAQNDEIRREIVVNPGTGEILRDYAVMLSKIAGGKPAMASSAGSAVAPSSAANPGTGGGATTGAAGVLGLSTLQTDDGTTAASDPAVAPTEPESLLTPDDGLQDDVRAPEVILIDPILPFSADEP